VYETVNAPLSADMKTVLTRYETPKDPPNFYTRTIGAEGRKATTSFKDPQPQLRGIERRLAAGMKQVRSVASLFVSRWDKAVASQVAGELQNRLGIAIALRTYLAYLELYSSARWQRLASAGARPQRMLWASTGTKDPNAPESLYAEAFAAPATIDTLPEKTLLALSRIDHLPPPMPTDGGDSLHTLAEFQRAGVDVDALAARLQKEGAEAFVKSWNSLMQRIAQQSGAKGAPRQKTG
jgi:transaldolase